MRRCKLHLLVLLSLVSFQMQLHAYDLPVMLAKLPDSSVTFWQQEKYRPDYYFQFKTDNGSDTMHIAIYGYDLDSITMSSQQIDGYGLREVILSYSISRGRVDYIDDQTINEH